MTLLKPSSCPGAVSPRPSTTSLAPAATPASIPGYLRRRWKRLLEAWREVDDSLLVYDAEQRRRNRLASAVALNRRGLGIAQQRYKAGALDYLDVLNVQKQLLDAQGQLEPSKANAAENLVASCKSLGGGWETIYANDFAGR
ncbi:RND transporter [Caballeronia catudaia]|uniref:RND transporter n=1 Tax=Caballeronia catudaia TaxID=1777136 RepID=A0A158B591_9BURK|nr:RND transporter [Caballeronia catudaia]